MANLVITIDGPAASGKSTVARLLAEKLGARFLDTGAMYRAVTLAALEAGADMTNDTKLLTVMHDSDFKFDTQQGKTKVSINAIDVTDKIRSPEVTANARYVASKPKLRDKLVQMQRKLAQAQKRIVTEGRDQGTVAFPDADIKFFLTAEPKERARRRQADLQAKGSEQDIDRVRTDIDERDRSDEGRAVGPLKPAHDAIIVDTTKLSIEQVVQKLLNFVERCS